MKINREHIQNANLTEISVNLFILFMYVVFLVIPFLVDVKVKRLRIENFSYISELVKKDIFGNFDVSNFKVSRIAEEIYERCQSSQWAKDCRVSFELPDTLVVDFKEVLPVAFLVESDGRISILSDSGNKIETQVYLSDIVNFREEFRLPFIMLRSERCEVENLSRFIVFVNEVAPDFIDQIVCSDFSVEIYSTEKYKVILPSDDLFGAFSKFLSMRNQIKNASEIDVRGEDGIFIK